MPSLNLFIHPTDFLYMLWPTPTPVPAAPLVTGYRLRYFVEADAGAYCALVNLDRWEDTGWRCSEYSLRDMRIRAVPRGFFVIEAADGALVATAIARHRPDADTYYFPDGGEVCLVFVHPAHRRQGLGQAVTTATVQRLQEIGYQNIYLNVMDQRLPALQLYFTLGFQPLLYNAGVMARWRQICTTLGHPFAAAQWPQQVHLADEGNNSA